MTLRLTPTSYAILGQIALRPRSTYELAIELRRNAHYFWPRAESLIYAEVKRLAALGLANASHEFTGRRRRTVYAVTDAGLEELRSWLATPPERTHLMAEVLVRLLIAPIGDVGQARQAIESARNDARELLDIAAGIREEYLAGTAPFQEHVAYRAHVYDLLNEWGLTLEAWAERALGAFASWEDMDPIERDRRALALFDRRSLPPAPSPKDGGEPGSADKDS